VVFYQVGIQSNTPFQDHGAPEDAGHRVQIRNRHEASSNQSFAAQEQGRQEDKRQEHQSDPPPVPDSSSKPVRR